MTSVDIQPVAESAFAMIENEEEERAFVEDKAEKVAAAANWFARKKLFVELLEELDASAELATELAETPEFAALMEEAAKEFKEEMRPPGSGDADASAEDEPEEDASDDEALTSDPFAVVAPVYVGAILERLGETKIESLEQAAIYVLSTHEEHQLAAWSWFNAAPKGLERFRKFMKENPRYHEALQRLVFVEAPFNDGEET